jgi:hypothetical protein
MFSGVKMQIVVFWVSTRCRLVGGGYQYSTRTNRLRFFFRIQGMKMEAVDCSETLVSHLLYYMVSYPQRPQSKIDNIKISDLHNERYVSVKNVYWFISETGNLRIKQSLQAS